MFSIIPQTQNVVFVGAGTEDHKLRTGVIERLNNATRVWYLKVLL